MNRKLDLKSDKFKCFDCNNAHLLTINCPYTQKHGLMCSLNHSDTIKNSTWGMSMWCKWAIKKDGDRYIYCPKSECPASLPDNPCLMRHR